MKNQDLQIENRLLLLKQFYDSLIRWYKGEYSKEEKPQLRSFINRNIIAVKNAVKEAGTLKLMTVSPPPVVGGPIIRDFDPFENIFIDFFGISPIPSALDSIDQAIGVYEHIQNDTNLIKLISKEAIDIESAIERALRPSFRISPPNNERDVQDSVENILNALGIDFVRDKEVAPVGPKAFRPDFTVPNMDLAIEVKLAKKGHTAAQIQEEISADITGYRTKWKRLLIVVYDLGIIDDPYKFRKQNMKFFGVSLIIIKH